MVNAIYRQVVDDANVLDASRLSPAKTPVNILLTGEGDLNIWLLDYMARKDSLPLHFYSPHDTDNADVYVRALDQADFVLAADAKTPVYSRRVLSAKVQDNLQAILRERPADFTQTARFHLAQNDRCIYLFQRNAVIHGDSCAARANIPKKPGTT
jgi:hypothetical protein